MVNCESASRKKDSVGMYYQDNGIKIKITLNTGGQSRQIQPAQTGSGLLVIIY